MLLSALLPLLVSSGVPTEGSEEAPSPSFFESGRSMWEAPEDGKPAWSGSLTGGVTIVEGNSRETSANFLFGTIRRTAIDRFNFNGYYNFSKADTTPGVGAGLEEVVKNAGLGAKYDYFLRDDLYALGNTSIQTDDPAGIDLRFILGAGLGWQVREDEKVKWGLEGGLSHVTSDYDTRDDESYLGARLASNLNYGLSENSSFEQVTEYLPSLENFKNLYFKVDNRLKMNIAGNWIGQLQYVFEYTEPPGGFRVDQRLVFTIGWSFGD